METLQSFREQVFRYVRRKYHSEIEYLWARYPTYAIFRHQDNKKWYGLIMDVPRARLGIAGSGIVDVLNIKTGDALLSDLLIQQEGYLPGYHISSGGWVSILLDGTVAMKEIRDLIDRSYLVTASQKTKNGLRPAKEWLIPSNPQYFDIVHAFDNTDIINWKQGQSIKKDDTVFLYVGAPVSAILYKCRVVETDIPYPYQNPHVNITALMRIQLLRRYSSDRFPFERLKTDYGIFAVRGPRGVPEMLSEDLKR